MPEHSRNGCSQSCPLTGKPARCFAKIPVISICNALWSTHLYKHQSGSPEGMFVYRSFSLIVRLLLRVVGEGYSNPKGEYLLLLPVRFLFPPHSPSSSVGVCAEPVLPTHSPPPWGEKRENMGQAEGSLLFWSILVKPFQIHRST